MDLTPDIESKPFPDFVPIQFEFDGERMLEELNCVQQYYIKTGADYARLDKPLVSEAVCSKEELMQVSYHGVDEDGVFFNEELDIPSWREVNLKRLPDDFESQWGSAKYLGHRPGEWVWNPVFADHISYTRSVVESLPYEYIDRVVVLTIPENGIGPLHKDGRNPKYWDHHGNVSTSLVLRTGGVSFVVHADDVDHYIPERAFLFKDCFYHGVPRTRFQRTIIRISGKPRTGEMKGLCVMEQAHYWKFKKG